MFSRPMTIQPALDPWHSELDGIVCSAGGVARGLVTSRRFFWSGASGSLLWDCINGPMALQPVAFKVKAWLHRVASSFVGVSVDWRSFLWVSL